VCLQELKAEDHAFPVAELRAAGYGAVWHGQKSWNGVAILARGATPVEPRRGLAGDPADTQSRYIEAVAHGIVVGCLYLPNGNPQPGPKYDYKLQWFDRLIAHAAGLSRGGVPARSSATSTSSRPTSTSTTRSRGRRTRCCSPESANVTSGCSPRAGSTRCAAHPEGPIYTFWDYFRQHWQRDAGLRIDHLLLNPELAPRLVDAGVDRWVRGLEGTSDHAPTWITFTGAPTPADDDGDHEAPPARVPAATGPAPSPAKTTAKRKATRR
jgi:exodeoxyribonuclease-3